MITKDMVMMKGNKKGEWEEARINTNNKSYNKKYVKIKIKNIKNGKKI